MAQALIFEPILSHYKQLESMLHSLSPELEIFHFQRVEDFLRAYEESKPPEVSLAAFQVDPAVPPEPAPPEKPKLKINEILLLIVDSKSTDKISMDLWYKLVLNIRVLRKDEKDPTRFLFTGFESEKEEFDPRIFNSQLVFNVLVKPFDPLIVSQTLKIALGPDGPMDVDQIYEQEVKKSIEMIKDIEIEMLTELGFRTRSTRAIQERNVARYFGPVFEGSQGDSVFAYCYANYQHPDEPKRFTSSFSFLGIPREQLASIRKNIHRSKDKIEHTLEDRQPLTTENPRSLILISSQKSWATAFDDFAREKLLGVPFAHFGSLNQIYKLIPPQLKGEWAEPVAPIFDVKGEVEFKFTDDLKKTLSLLSVPESKIVKQFLDEPLGADLPPPRNFLSRFEESSQKTLLKMFRDPTSFQAQTLYISSGEEPRPIFLVGLSEVTEPKIGPVFLLKLREPSDEEIFELNKSQKPPPASVVLLDGSRFSGADLNRVKTVFKALEGDSAAEIKYVMVTKNSIDSYSALQYAAGFDDVVQYPIDLFYLTRKLKMHVPELALKNREDGLRLGIQMKGGIKTARLLEINRISEVHLSFNYYRPLRPNEMRRFILWVPNTKKMPEIFAVCRHCEKLEEGVYRCDFMNFGVTDRQLKHIRDWIKSNYVQSKSESE